MDYKMRSQLLVIFLLLFSFSCMQVPVIKWYEKDTNFRNYQTFNFAEEVRASSMDPEIKDLFVSSVKKEMMILNYKLSNDADLSIDLKVVAKGDRTRGFREVRINGEDFRHEIGSGLIKNYGSNVVYIEGAIWVFIFDRKNKKIFEGRAQGSISNMEKNKLKIQKGVGKIFKGKPFN